MKRIATCLVVGFFAFSPALRAEDVPVPAPVESAAPEVAVAVAQPAEPVVAEPALLVLPDIAPAASETTPTPAVVQDPDNLEFVSGEVASLDEASRSITVKLYGETENSPSDKTLKVTVDDNTDITDGEQDRDLKTLTAGTEVDVEYDPSNSKATYIFVY